ncbi:MAG: HxsD-like protein [Candidatus Woesearchaeota archaeon]|jgi:hypothetical protein|nr:HxsD-like protein [Candidatus Woesearchaeota archaeon]
MSRVEFKDNFAFVYLNKEIYSKAAILSSLDVYKDFSDYILFENTKDNILKISAKGVDFTLKEVVNEFSNYLIGEEYSEISKNGL